MFKIDQFGKDAYQIGIHVKDGIAQWQNRLFRVYAATELPNGCGSVPAWLNHAAGVGPIPSLESDWLAAPDTTAWKSLGTAGKAFLDFVKAASKVARKESPRSYGSVIGIGTEAVATDGFRLIKADVGFTSAETVCIPVACLKAIADSVKAAKTMEVRLSEDATTMAFVSEKVRVYVRLSAVKFPAYQAILPKETGIEVTSAEIEAVKDQAKLIKKANVKPTKEYVPHVMIGGKAFNPSFVVDMPEADSYRLMPEAEMLLSIGKIQTVLVSIRLAS